VTVTLTGAEAEALNSVLGSNYLPNTDYDISAQTIERALPELDAKSRWPGTKLFDHEAAFRAEMLRRVLGRAAM